MTKVDVKSHKNYYSSMINVLVQYSHFESDEIHPENAMKCLPSGDKWNEATFSTNIILIEQMKMP